MGIKELIEFLYVFEAAAGTYADVMDDGKIDLADVSKLFALFPAIGDALAGAGEIPAELSDLDAEEAARVWNAIRRIYNEWRSVL